jgi:hypothetical protein
VLVGGERLKSVDNYLQAMISMIAMKNKAGSERLPKGKMFWQIIIDEKLQRKFKSRCVEAGRTMSGQVEELVRAWLK